MNQNEKIVAEKRITADIIISFLQNLPTEDLNSLEPDKIADYFSIIFQRVREDEY